MSQVDNIISALTFERSRITVPRVKEDSFGIGGSRIYDLSVQ